MSIHPGRRSFLNTAASTAGFLFSGAGWKAAAAQKNKVKIRDVKCMLVRGTWDWNLIKIETDQPGLYGIGEVRTDRLFPIGRRPKDPQPTGDAAHGFNPPDHEPDE